MEVIEVYKPFDIQEIELLEWKQRPVKNNFFEVVLIKEGRGTQCINYNHYPYTAGSIFLLPPLKCHSFKINTPSKFVLLKFTSDFFKARERNKVKDSVWFKEASYILSNYDQLPGDIIHSELDNQHINTLIELILTENRNYSQTSMSLIKSVMTSILKILLRNIRNSPFYENQQISSSDQRINILLRYINEHISEPKLLRVEHLSKMFLLSPTYLSEYFRKSVKISLREYIIKGRLKLVEIRLLNSKDTLTQIASDLNFTDVSHLSKTFKQHTGMSIREFKKKGEYIVLKRSTCKY